MNLEQSIAALRQTEKALVESQKTNAEALKLIRSILGTDEGPSAETRQLAKSTQRSKARTKAFTKTVAKSKDKAIARAPDGEDAAALRRRVSDLLGQYRELAKRDLVRLLEITPSEANGRLRGVLEAGRTAGEFELVGALKAARWRLAKPTPATAPGDVPAAPVTPPVTRTDSAPPSAIAAH